MAAISLSKLDLSFLRKNDPNGVRPGRYRWSTIAQSFVTLHEWHRLHPVEDRRGAVPIPYFMPDIDAAYGGAWKSIIDGSEISSRPNWREHNKRNEVLQVDSDFWGKSEDHFVNENKQRAAIGFEAPKEDVVFGWKDSLSVDLGE